MDENEQIYNISLLTLDTIIAFLATVVLPVANAAVAEAETCNGASNTHVLSSSVMHLIRSLYHLQSLTATCAQGFIPRPRIQHALFPNFIGSRFTGRDFFDDLQNCEHLFWTLTGESVESFRQIVRDVAPSLLRVTRRGGPRQRQRPYMLDERNRILAVVIWLRMYPEIAVLSGMFMVSPTTIEREIRMILPFYETISVNYLRWPTTDEWLQMENR